MSFPAFDEPPAWGTIKEPPTGDIVKEAVKKDQIIKEVVAAQEDLRALMARVHTVQGDIGKLTSGNATLQMYIDNLTMQMAKRR